MWLSVEASGSAPQSCTRTAMGGTQPIDIYMAQLWPVLCQSRSALCEPVVEKSSFSYHPQQRYHSSTSVDWMAWL